MEDLRHFRNGDAVVDRDLHLVLLDFEHAAKTAVRDQQSCRPQGRRWRERDERDGSRQAAQSIPKSE